MLFVSLLTTLDAEGQDCVNEIFETHKNLIYKIAFQIIQNVHDAEDTLDDVMVKVINNIHRFQNADSGAVVAQLIIYSRNAAINVYRKNKRRNKVEVPLTYSNDEEEAEDIEYPDTGRSVEEIALSNDANEIIRKYIKKLPLHYQDAIELVYFFGYPNVDAARILHITPNAVALRLFKSKKMLLDMAGGELNELI